jgi:hypothetical protein
LVAGGVVAATVAGVVGAVGGVCAFNKGQASQAESTAPLIKKGQASQAERSTPNTVRPSGRIEEMGQAREEMGQASTEEMGQASTAALECWMERGMFENPLRLTWRTSAYFVCFSAAARTAA